MYICVFVYVYICIYVYTYICTYIETYTYIYVYIYLNTYMYLYIYIIYLSFIQYLCLLNSCLTHYINNVFIYPYLCTCLNSIFQKSVANIASDKWT